MICGGGKVLPNGLALPKQSPCSESTISLTFLRIWAFMTFDFPRQGLHKLNLPAKTVSMASVTIITGLTASFFSNDHSTRSWLPVNRTFLFACAGPMKIGLGLGMV